MKLSKAMLQYDKIELEEFKKINEDFLTKEVKEKIEKTLASINKILNIQSNVLLSKEDARLRETYINKYDK
jgi:hypothetical protein